MPRIMGVNVVAVLVASIVFFMLGWAWYGMLAAGAIIGAMS